MYVCSVECRIIELNGNKLENKCESHYITFEKSFGQVPEGSEDISNQLKGTKQVNIDSDIVIEQEM